ncbi:MAG: hypothetical protein AB7O98_04690 [Hyphomonadaceae bacterium]
MADAPDPKGAMKIVLDKEIEQAKAEVEKLQKEGADAAKIEAAKNKLRYRQIQRAQMGP